MKYDAYSTTTFNIRMVSSTEQAYVLKLLRLFIDMPITRERETTLKIASATSIPT